MTILEEPKSVQITRSMVDDFREATKDYNKLHQDEGGGAIALGFQLGGMLRHYADREIVDVLPHLSCVAQETHFGRAVPIDSYVGFKVLASPETYGDGKRSVVGLMIDEEEEPAARSTLVYSSTVPGIRKANDEGIAYMLKPADGIAVARGLGLLGTRDTVVPDLDTLMLGLASNALYEKGQAFVRRATESGLLPIYSRHRIQPHMAMQRDSMHHVEFGKYIIISTNAAESIKKIERQLRQGKDLQDLPCTTNIVATTTEGYVVYEAQLRLAFRTKEQILGDRAA